MVVSVDKCFNSDRFGNKDTARAYKAIAAFKTIFFGLAIIFHYGHVSERKEERCFSNIQVVW